MRAYSARNRSASIRIPYEANPKGRRIEVRFGDAAGNPYLTFAAMLMAGLDGIQNQIDPGSPQDKDLYDLPAGRRSFYSQGMCVAGSGTGCARCRSGISQSRRCIFGRFHRWIHRT